jgi:hypothetical protein
MIIHQQRFIEGLRIAAQLPDHRSEFVLPAHARRIDFLLPAARDLLGLESLGHLPAERLLAVEHVSATGSVVDAAKAEMAQRWLYTQWRRYRTKRGRIAMRTHADLFEHRLPPIAVVIAQRLAWRSLLRAYPGHKAFLQDVIIWLPGPENSGVALVDSARLPSDIGGDVLRWLTAADPVLHQRYYEDMMNNPTISPQHKAAISRGVMNRPEVFTAGERETASEKLERETWAAADKLRRAEVKRVQLKAQAEFERAQASARAEARTMCLNLLADAGIAPPDNVAATMSNDELHALLQRFVRGHR